jgi:hypothetical protein
MLILKRASLSRPSGKWSADDYDVVERDQHGEKDVGRIMRAPQAPEGTPWFWSITARVPQYPHDRGCAATREDAMTAFKAAWSQAP